MKRNTAVTALTVAAISLTVLLAVAAPFTSAPPAARAAPVTLTAGARYPYQSAAFARFVADSFQNAGKNDPQRFYRWMDRAIASGRGQTVTGAKKGQTWADLLQARRAALSAVRDPGRRTARQRETCAWLHKTVKTIIPRFSLDRGFEFTNTALRGERQCFLQSVLVAGLLQQMDVDAGVAMVQRNTAGQTTNNGHAVCVARLANGRDILVDCSEPTPFVRQQGLFLPTRHGAYRFVQPRYASVPGAPVGSGVITGYVLMSTGQKLAPRGVRFLPTDFLRSQFDYYRGERAPGGFLASRPTPAGLEASARYLRRAAGECPQNPLAVYVLGRVYLKQRKLTLARAQVQKSLALYQSAGWVPPGQRDALALVGSSRTAAAR